MERELIGSVQLNTTQTGKAVADLFSTDTRLQYPVLRLFDLSALTTVGLDPTTMGNERFHKRFWAYYTVSTKINKDGHPYKDVEYLEPIDQPATATSVDSSELLVELREIRRLLEIIAVKLELPDAIREQLAHRLYEALAGDDSKGMPPALPTPKAPNQVDEQTAQSPTVGSGGEIEGNDLILRYGDGAAVSDNDAETQAFTDYVKAEGTIPPSVEALRQWVRNS